MIKTNKIKNMILVVSLVILIFTFISCSSQETVQAGQLFARAEDTIEESDDLVTVSEQNDSIEASQISVEFDPEDLDASIDDPETSFIKLKGDSINLEGSGVVVEESIATITASGVFIISGTLDDGQIIVDTEDKDPVRLILNGADISCSNSAPIYIINANKIVITLAEGTDNFITDGDQYQFEDTDTNEPNAAIFSNDDLTINGEGSLTVNANYQNGISTDDDLKIVSGNIEVSAVNDGIKGKNSLAIKDGSITVEAGNDGIQSENSEDSDKGFIFIQDCILDITAGTDGIEAEMSILIGDGTFYITTGGGSSNSSTDNENWGNRGKQKAEVEDSPSAKGIKAGSDLVIKGGNINIDSSDDSIHSNNTMTINGGEIILSSGDDGIHADTSIIINDGNITITKSYEGIESAIIDINGGHFNVISSDDSINISGGNDRSSMGGRPGQNEFTTSGNDYLQIDGGYIVLDSGGDGLDINGGITMTGGTVIVNGPTDNGNGAIDYYTYFNIEGGTFIAVGSAGMAQAPSESSSQYSVMINMNSIQSGNTLIHFETGDGEDIITLSPSKEYQSIVFSSPLLESGMGLVVYTGGSITGESIEGLYTEGTYKGGTEVVSLIISGIVTTSGNATGMMLGERGRRNSR